MVITLQKRGTITISAKMRKELGIEPGDPLEARVEKGRLVLIPVAIIPKKLRLTESGERKMAEAEEDIRMGRVKTFDSVKDLLEDLNENHGD